MAGARVISRREMESKKRKEILDQKLQELLDTKSKYDKLLVGIEEDDTYNLNNIDQQEASLLNELADAIDNLKGFVSSSLHTLANVVTPINEDEKQYKEIIKSVSVEIDDDDMKNPDHLINYVHFMSSQKVFPKVDSFSKSEMTALVANEFRKIDSNAYKLALVHKMADSILLHKNLDNMKVVQGYFLGKDKPLTNSMYLEMIQKHKDYNQLKYNNIEKVCRYCSVDFNSNSTFDKRLLENIENETALASLVQYSKIYNKNIDATIDIHNITEKYFSCQFDGKSSKESFAEFAEILRRSGVKDPSGNIEKQALDYNVDSYISLN